MNKIFIIIFCVVFLLAIIALINFLPLFFMKPMESGQILDTGIYAVNNKINNMYLIETNDSYIAIDAGSDTDKVIHNLEEMKINPTEIKHVFLTHTDSDHVASLNLFPNAQIYMSEDELQMVDGTLKRSLLKRNMLPEGISQNSLILLTDGQEIVIGGHTISCIKISGHTPGSMAYQVDTQYLFTGDSIKITNNIISTHPYTMDKENSKISIKKINEILNETQLVITAHYGYHKSEELTIE